MVGGRRQEADGRWNIVCTVSFLAFFNWIVISAMLRSVGSNFQFPIPNSQFPSFSTTIHVQKYLCSAVSLTSQLPIEPENTVERVPNDLLVGAYQ